MTLVVLATALVCGWWAHELRSVRQERAALLVVKKRQAQLTPPPNHWIDEALHVEHTPLPIWLSWADEPTADVVRRISFDVRSHDDGFELPSDILDQDLHVLRSFRKLHTLALPRSRISDTGLKTIGQLTSLRVLDLSGTQISDDGLAHLRKLHGLETLRLDSTPLTGQGLESLAALPNLRELWLRNVKLEDVSALNKLRRLEKLVLHSSTLDRLELKDLPHLNDVSIILGGDTAFVQLTNLPELMRTELHLEPAASIRRLELVDLPKLKILDLRSHTTGLETAEQVRLQDLPSLEAASLTINGRIGPLPRQLSTLASLQSLVLSCDRRSLNDEAAVELGTLRQLRRLELHPTQLTDAGVAHFANLIELEDLSLDCRKLPTVD